MTPLLSGESPVETMHALGKLLGVELLVKRDDLLPFPLAGNKARKLASEYAAMKELPSLVITNGAINSNHCRTMAMMAARVGIGAHCVLHGSVRSSSDRVSIEMLRSLGATIEIVEPSLIAERIQEAVDRATNAGGSAHVIAGGCHTPAGAVAYRDIGVREFDEHRPDVVIVPSGTGATHGGLAAAAAHSASSPRVIGVSIARDRYRGIPPVREAAAWAGAPDAPIEFLDAYRDGGYGLWTDATAQGLDVAWRYGLPVDQTYTAKAFVALQDLARSGDIASGSRVLFWHTGGLWNYVAVER